MPQFRFANDQCALAFGANPTQLGEISFIPQSWHGDLLGQFREPFLDQVHIQSHSGVAFSVNKPTKDVANNPIMQVVGANTATWDYQKVFVSPIYMDGSWKLLYDGAEFASPQADRPCYATSLDGITWTKPNLGLISYDASTVNNIMDTGRWTSFRFYSDLALYVATCENRGFGAKGYVFTSTDPTAGWTLRQTINPGSSIEAKDIVRREDGRWLVYLTVGHSTDERHVVAYLSADTDPGSVYSNLGTIIAPISVDDQRYALGCERVGELHYGFLMNYNATEQQTRVDLYFSRDGLAWSNVSENWLPRGAGGSFDDELIFLGNRLVEVDDIWWYYYCGSPVKHEVPRPKDMRIGRASIPKGRIGQVTGTGVVTTARMLPTSGQTLSVNCNANGGTIEVEILDQFGQTLSGYTQAAATDITTDTYAITPSWAGSLAMPTGTPISLRFHLSAATLYGYTII